jgi:hypothetical protein
VRLRPLLAIIALYVVGVLVASAQSVNFKNGEPQVGETQTIVTAAFPANATNGTVSIFTATNGTCPSTAPINPLGSAQIGGNGDITVKLSSPLSNGNSLCLFDSYVLAGQANNEAAGPITVGAPPSNPASSATAPQAYKISLAPATIDKDYLLANGQLNGLDFLPQKDKTLLVSGYAQTACVKVSHWNDVKDEGGTYYVFNTLVLDPSGKVTSSTWQIYNPHATWFDGIKVMAPHWGIDQVQGMRFYGARNLVVIPLVVSAKSLSSISYTPQFTAATATNVGDFRALLGILFPGGQTAAPAAANTSPDLYAGCAIIPVAHKYRTSSIELDTNSSDSTTAAKGTFVSEANAWWDVSFAFPVTKASALSYSSTDNTVTATSLSRQNLFAVADFFIPKVDLKIPLALHYIPHPFGGVAISGKPLHNLLFGLSMGTSIVEIYAGAQLVKTQNLGNGLSTGSGASQGQVSAATTYSFVPSASFGIKVSIPNGAKLLSSAAK